MKFRVVLSFILASLITGSAEGQYSLDVTDIVSAAGSNTQVSVNIDNAAPVLGFSFGVTHDGSVLTPLESIREPSPPNSMAASVRNTFSRTSPLPMALE